MIIILTWLVVAGLCLGSFVNAAVWRIHEQSIESEKKRPSKKYLLRLSILRGRSMCSNCHHVLAPKDLVPVLSWLYLKGKCRYCASPIPDTPFAEIATAALFVASYLYWPNALHGVQIVILLLWLVILVGLMILVLYDLRWLLLPNRVVYPLFVIAIIETVCQISTSTRVTGALINVALALLIGGGLFYVLFQVSGGKWIGGGDVKLGWLLGLLVGTPARSVLFIFIAAISGSLVSVPLLVSGKLRRSSVIPFGPFLILGAIIVQLFGVPILNWYEHLLLVSN
jgi:prepilin signal peptidase PulO-like enzyme (type II secretory pathway)